MLKHCLFAAAVLFPATAVAQTQPAAPQPNPLDPVYACAPISDDHERLTCYDNAVRHVREAQNSGDLVAIDRHQAQQLDHEAFGFHLPSLPRLFSHGEEAPATELPLQIESISHRADGKPLFRMTNGQVWAQIDSMGSPLARAGGAVTIRRASLGSYLMMVQAGGRPIRVQRQE